MASQPLFPSGTQRSVLSPPRVVGRRTHSDMRGSPHFPQNAFNIVYGQLDHGLGSNPRHRRPCFRDMDSSGGRGKHKLSSDDGNIPGIEPLLISRLAHPDSNRQLDLRIVPKTPGRHQGAPAALPDLEVVPSLHGSQHPSVAVHLAVKLNTLVDQLSRVTKPVATEWTLNVFRAILQTAGFSASTADRITLPQ